jgi:hypothetical protein
MKTKALQQTVLFKASPRQVYDMLMDSKKHQSLSGQRARAGTVVQRGRTPRLLRAGSMRGNTSRRGEMTSAFRVLRSYAN